MVQIHPWLFGVLTGLKLSDSLGYDGFSGQDGTSSGKLTGVGSNANESENTNEDKQLDEVGCACMGKNLPKQHQYGLCDRYSPH